MEFSKPQQFITALTFEFDDLTDIRPRFWNGQDLLQMQLNAAFSVYPFFCSILEVAVFLTVGPGDCHLFIDSGQVLRRKTQVEKRVFFSTSIQSQASPLYGADSAALMTCAPQKSPYAHKEVQFSNQ